MIKNIFSKKYIKKYEKKLKYIGPNNKMKLDHFLLSRLFLSIILLIVCILIPKYGIILGFVVVPLFYFLYTIILVDNKISKRSDKLYEEALVFFNMLKLAYIQTNDLKISLDIVTNKLGNSISLEFKKLLANNKYNNDLNEVLKMVIDTIPNYDVRNQFVDLKENNNYLETIDNIINNLRIKNASVIKQKYQYKPVVLSFVSIIFIFVICYLILNSYNIINYFS